MTNDLITKADAGDFSNLFRIDLFWHSPDQAPIEIEFNDGQKVTATNVSSFKGVRVWEVPTLPGSAAEAKLDQAIAKNSTNRLVIFHDGDKQVWRWPSRTAKGGGVISRPARHVHKIGSPDPKFVAKLDAILLPSDVVLDVNDLLSRVRGAFDFETKNETKRASKLMAQMYAAVDKGYQSGSDPMKKRDHEISVSLARILFLLFGDDTEMWKDAKGEPRPDLFQDFVKDHTERDGSDIAERFNALFEVLDTAPKNRAGLKPELAAFPYVDGGIFEEHITLPHLDKDLRDAILSASAVDWSTISPAIFGSMFQSVRDAQTRRELGEHYTSEENILKTLNPLFLDELRAEFDHIRGRRVGQRQKLHDLWKRLGDIRYMDPACGCGNFIIIAYRELRDLELRIMDALATLTDGEETVALPADWTNLLKVTLDHFYGIEIDEWPARIAETAMFLIDRQCDLKMKERFGVAPERFPIQESARIVVNNALTIDWADIVEPSADVVVAGNPPFLGISLRSAAQTAELETVWGARYHGTLDYVTGWHACALRYFADLDGRWAFVATSSITQGEAVAPLFRPILQDGWHVKFGHRTFKWTSEATGQAAVHCVIVGFERAPAVRRLFNYLTPDGTPVEVDGVKNVSPYLTDGATVIVDSASRPLNPQMGQVTYGNKPTDGGWLIVDDDALADAKADSVAANYLRPFVGARELLHGGVRHCLWLVDSTTAERKNSPFVSKRVKKRREFLLVSDAASTRDYANNAHLFRQIAQPSVPYLCIPAHVSEDRPYFLAAHFSPEVITSNANFLSEDADGLVFAVISSTMFMVWQRTVGGRLESRLRFNKLLSWNTFPLPSLAAGDRAAIIAAGKAILDARESLSGIPLANMYPPEGLDSDLQAAHDTLDRVVDSAFDLKVDHGATELERQDILFAKYQEFTSGLLASLERGRRRRRVRGSRA